ncbi:ABC transporter ATP-binding protein [Pseudomonas oryziphila]|uniref:ABC transporter ATP-binding protein n=1 Tax=Pseudomonas entomophila TaxID=312306 RepID=A0A3S8UH23_9PSED|nr:ABC transporter ATP-binding protein [Pseudomonas oryziphila]AZL67603.1 ABC transporter ATP-binding protein [Pseudomonas oryziphila]
MIKLVRELVSLMSSEQRKSFLYLQFFVVLMAIAEVVGVAAVGPFMALVGNMELIQTNAVVNNLYLQSGLSSPIEFLFFTGVAVLVFLAVSAVLSVVTIWKLSNFAASTGAEMGDALYAYYLKQNILYHSVTTSSQLTKQIATEVARITDHVLQPLVQINARIVAALFISVAIFAYNPIISLAGLLVFFTAYVSLFFVVRGRLARNGKMISRVSKQRFTLMNEGFGAIRDVQLLGRESSFIRAFQESGRVFARAYGSSNGLYNMPRYLMEFIVYSGMVGLILILLKVHEGDLSAILPVLAVFGLAAFKLLPSFQQIYSGVAQVKSNISAFESIKHDLSLARASSLTSMIGRTEGDHLQGDVEFRSVEFCYPDKPTAALKNISLRIPRGAVVGIVGPSGSGKSTLIDLFLGLITPDKGAFLVGERVVDRNNVRQWQEQLGYVPQSIFLTEGTITENVAFGVEPEFIDAQKVKRAIQLAHLDEWVDALPDAYETRIGERGVQISGGQRQRLGIARALYDDADILVFDEATSALDGVTEKMIMEAVERFSHKKTIIMIAHRLNTIKNCDVIFMLDQGRVVDQGTYEYLMVNNEYFNRMASSS